MKKLNMCLAALLLLSLAFGACRRNNDNTNRTAQVSMRLTDAPADYDAIYLDIQQIAVTMSGSSEVTLALDRPGRYNLLDFRNGMDTLLLKRNLPPGTIQQMRLILGSNNSIVVDGVSYPLSTPSAQESGIKLNLNQTFEANGSYEVWIDFDAAKSILQTGSGNYKLKPVIRAYSALTNGKIEGFVAPLAAFATVYAINGTDTSAAIPAATNGYFRISGLATGTYQLMVVPSVTTYATTTIPVNVTFGVVTNVGTVTLLP